MAIDEISTRSISEINLEGRSTSCISSFFGDPQRNLEVPLTKVPFIDHAGNSPSDLILSTLSDGNEPDWGIVCKSVPSENEVGSVAAEEFSSISFEDIESYIRCRFEPSWDQLDANLKRFQQRMQNRALTNRLRNFDEAISSRPLLNLEETRWLTDMPEEKSKKVPVTVSPSLLNKVPATKIGGLGHVSAGLLLWLESSEADDEHV